MSEGKAIWSVLLALAITGVVVSTAYLAAGALHDRMLPEGNDLPATVEMMVIDTEGLGGVQDHPQVPATWGMGEEYDIGVRVVGLRSDSGVLVKFSIARPDISTEDVSVYYYDAVSNSWRPLTFQDEGDVLVTTLGLSGGIAVYDGYDHLHRLLIFSYLDGSCQVKAWIEMD